MHSRRARHPSERSLRAFDLGKLSDAAGEVILSHVSACVRCRDTLNFSLSDSFVSGLRAAHASAGGTHSEPVSDSKPEPCVVEGEPEPTGGLPVQLFENAEYEVIRELGRGGMGIVYLARDKMMDRNVVLKVLRSAYLERPDTRQRFIGEMRAAAQLDHPNIVKALACLQSKNLIVFVMECVDGEDLHWLVKNQGPLPVAKACWYAFQAALGLQHAHEKGMVHRDIKPHNLMLARGKSHVIKILDFGLAKASREKGEEFGLTREGQMLGTPEYVAPEQTLDATAVTILADIYSLGCTLYFLLTGSPPFTRKTAFEIVAAHHNAEVPPLVEARRDVPVGLQSVLCKMMAKKPADRYELPADVARDLLPFFKDASASAARPATVPPPAAARPHGPKMTPSMDARKVKAFQPGTVPPPRRHSQKKTEEPFDDLNNEYAFTSNRTAARRRTALVAFGGLIFAIAMVAIIVCAVHPKSESTTPTKPKGVPSSEPRPGNAKQGENDIAKGPDHAPEGGGNPTPKDKVDRNAAGAANGGQKNEPKNVDLDRPAVE
jgi:serine/threonine protein kinase